MKLIAAMSLTAVFATACAQPLMEMPDELVGKADTYPVHGRQGFVIFEPRISFGPFRTVSLDRGVAMGERSSTPTGLFSSAEHDSDRHQFTFVLQGPSPGSWSGTCTAFSERRSETHVTGLHIGTDGAGLTREETPVSADSGYVCRLDGPAGEHWTLDADEHLAEGRVRDAAGRPIADIEEAHEPWTPKRVALEGNTIVGPAGDVWAAVQRSFDGAVYLSRHLDAQQQIAVAAICTALLVPGPSVQ
jgi:hypothetical protein